MSVASNTVPEFRLRWAGRFVDAVTILRVASRGTFNETTLAYDTPTDSSEYSGAALIRPMSPAAVTALFGEQLVTGRIYSVFIPHDAGDFQPEDDVTVDTSDDDPTLVGKTMTVLTQQHDSYRTRIEVVCRLEEGPGYAG